MARQRDAAVFKYFVTAAITCRPLHVPSRESETHVPFVRVCSDIALPLLRNWNAVVQAELCWPHCAERPPALHVHDSRAGSRGHCRVRWGLRRGDLEAMSCVGCGSEGGGEMPSLGGGCKGDTLHVKDTYKSWRGVILRKCEAKDAAWS
jgi:hypothetical protein